MHTDAEQVENGVGGGVGGAVGGGGGGDETEDDGSERAGMKRKRGPGRDDSDLRTEMARLRTENEDLRRQSDLQNRQTQEREYKPQLLALDDASSLQSI